MNLTESDLSHLNTLGYLRVRRMYSQTEVRELSSLFDEYLAGSLGDRRLGPGETVVAGPVMDDPRFFGFFDDDRVSGLARAVMGPGCTYLNNGFVSVQAHATPWHSDTVVPQIPQLKIAMYLDPVAEDDGCLTVVPGSHHSTFHEALRSAFDVEHSLDRGRRHLAAEVSLDTEPGDVVVFWRPLCHSTWGPQRGRRQIFANFAGPPARPVVMHTGAGETVVDRSTWQRTYLRRAATMIPTWQHGYTLFSPEFVDTAGPRRRELITPLLNEGFADFSSRPPMPTHRPITMFRSPDASAEDFFANRPVTTTPTAAMPSS